MHVWDSECVPALESYQLKSLKRSSQLPRQLLDRSASTGSKKTTILRSD